jgi:predicted dehydrogenase
MRDVDTVVLNLRFRNGALGHFTFTDGAVAAESPFIQVMVFGSEGTIWLENETVRLRRQDAAEETYTADRDAHGYYGEFLNFYEAIVHGAPVVVTPELALRDLEIIMRALDSAEDRSVILLP